MKNLERILEKTSWIKKAKTQDVEVVEIEKQRNIRTGLVLINGSTIYFVYNTMSKKFESLSNSCVYENIDKEHGKSIVRVIIRRLLK